MPMFRILNPKYNLSQSINFYVIVLSFPISHFLNKKESKLYIAFEMAYSVGSLPAPILHSFWTFCKGEGGRGGGSNSCSRKLLQICESLYRPFGNIRLTENMVLAKLFLRHRTKIHDIRIQRYFEILS